MNIFNHTAGARNSVSWVCAIQLCVTNGVAGVCAIQHVQQAATNSTEGHTKGVVGFMPFKMRPHWYGLGLYYTNGYNKWRTAGCNK